MQAEEYALQYALVAVVLHMEGFTGGGSTGGLTCIFAKCGQTICLGAEEELLLSLGNIFRLA